MLKQVRIFIAFLAVAGLGSGIANAGISTDSDVTCPVGGEIFQVTETLSCSTMGRRLSLKPITSCDFITRLPVCPKNKLPIYKDFSDDEIEKITAFMETDSYQNVSKDSHYLRAYLLSKEIEGEDSQERFFILQQGLWYGTEDKAELSEIYQAELDKINSKFDERDRPFWLAAGAFDAWSHGKTERALQLLLDARSLAEADNAYLQGYLNRLDACFRGNIDQDVCTASTKIPR